MRDALFSGLFISDVLHAPGNPARKGFSEAPRAQVLVKGWEAHADEGGFAKDAEGFSFF